MSNSSLLNGNSIGVRSLGKPAPVYPAAVATDSDLIIANDRQQTTLALPLNVSDISMTVTNAASIVPYNLLSIDNEIVKVTGSPSGNVIPISRGFDGTTPAVHLQSAIVAGFIDAYHHNRLVAEIEAIEQTLGPNLANVGATGLPVYLATLHNFAPQTPGGALTVGTNSITLTPVPKGVNGTNTQHYLYISGGTGTAEAIPITGGTAVSGAPSGTVFVTCANSHSGAWTVQSASGGISESIGDMPAGGGQVVVTVNTTIFADVADQGKSVVVQKLPGCTITWSGGVHFVLGCLPSGPGLEYYRNKVMFIYPNWGIPTYTGLYLQHGSSLNRIISAAGGAGSKGVSINSDVDASAADVNVEEVALDVKQSVTGTAGAGVGLRAQVTWEGSVRLNGGGTAVSAFAFSAVGGHIFGMNPFVRGNGTVQAALVGMEVNTDSQTVNASKIGIQIVDVATSTGPISTPDSSVGLRVTSQPGGLGYNHGILFDPVAGGYGVTAAGNLMTAKGGSVTRGIDFNTMSFAKTAIRAPLPTFASNAAAISGGLVAGDFYTDGAGNVKIVF